MARKAGREVIRLPADERERFAGAARPAVDSVLAEREGTGIPAKAIYAMLTSG